MKRYSDEEKRFMISNINKITNNEIAKSLGRTTSSVQSYLSKNDIYRDGVKTNVRYDYNHQYFDDINSYEKAYWLGMISADGCIMVKADGTRRVKLTLKSDDKPHLEKLNIALNSNIPIRDKSSILNDKIFHSVELMINSNHMAESLIKLGVTENKTFDMSLPNIDMKYMGAYIRGLFDGDGSYYYKENCKTYNKQYDKVYYRSRYQIELVGASHKLMAELKVLFEQMGIKANIYTKRKGNWKLMVSSKSSIVRYINWVFNKPVVVLDRKYETVRIMKKAFAG